MLALAACRTVLPNPPGSASFCPGRLVLVGALFLSVRLAMAVSLFFFPIGRYPKASENFGRPRDAV